MSRLVGHAHLLWHRLPLAVLIALAILAVLVTTAAANGNEPYPFRWR